MTERLHELNESARFKAAVKFAENLGKLAIVITAISWLIEIPDRKHQRDAAAWLLINPAAGQAHDGGRSTQLELLNDDGVSLESIDLHAGTFSHLRLRGADLRYANFSSTSLTGADFGCRRLWGACTQLDRAKFGDSGISGSSFAGANLQSAKFDGIDILRNSQLSDLDFGCKWTLSFHPRRCTELQDASFMYTNIRETSFAGAHLHNVAFNGSRFDHVSFAGAKLSQIFFVGLGISLAPYPGISLHSTDLSFSSFSNLDLHACDFQYAKISFTDFKNVHISSCDFSHAVLEKVEFNATSLDLTGVVFEGATFVDVDLSATPLSKEALIKQHAILCGVLFQGSSERFYDTSCPNHASANSAASP